MANRRRNYMRRVKLIEKYTLVRNICFMITVMMFSALILMSGSENITGIWYIMFATSLLTTGMTAFLEYIMLYCIAHEGDIKVRTIFGWTYEPSDRSYATFLKKFHLKDTVSNFERYYACIHK